MGCLGSNTVKDLKQAVKGEKYRIVFMVGAETSPLETVAKKAADDFRHTLINVNDLGQGKIQNALLNAIVKDITNEMQNNGTIKSSTLVKGVGLMLSTAKDKRVLIEGFPRNKEDFDEWNKQKSEDADTVCFFFVDVPDDKVYEAGIDDISKEKCRKFVEESKPFYESLASTLGDKFVKVDGTKSETDLTNEISNVFTSKKLF
jgi:hypothetical protein